MAKKKFVGCSVKELPAAQRFRAAREAVRVNPANAPRAAAVAMLTTAIVGAPPEPEHLALLTTKYWGARGVHLSVGFMEKTSAALQDKILEHLNAWGPGGPGGANVYFWLARSARQADVRISRGRGGYYSYLGTDIRMIPRGRPTMNLEAWSLSTPESEYKRVVRHETGHTLGFPHEHLRKAIIDRLDPAKTLAYFERTQGWSAAEVTAQVLTPLRESDLRAEPADETSCMTYDMPGECTRDGRPVAGGTDIDAEDADLVKKLYPVTVAPPGGALGR